MLPIGDIRATEYLLFVISIRHEYSYYLLTCNHQAPLIIENNDN